MSAGESLRRDVARATRVLVVAGSTYDAAHRQNNTVLADVRDPASIAALAAALAANPGDGAWMTPGDPTLVALDGREVLRLIQCVGPSGWIRCDSAWDGDAELLQPSAVADWIASVTQ